MLWGCLTFSALVADCNWFLFCRLDFQCRYYGSEVVSLVAEVNTVPPPLPVAAPGPLRVELRLASGQCEAKGAKGVHGCTDGKFLQCVAVLNTRAP